MTRLLQPHRIVSIVTLVAAWCALWGNLSTANVLSGLVIAVAVTSPRISTAGIGGIRLVPLLRLLRFIAVDLVRSTFTVAVEILTPHDRTDESIVEIELPSESRHHLLLIVTSITLTPGTAVVDVDRDAGLLYIHLLHDQNRVETVNHVIELAHLVCDVLPLRKIGTTA